MGKQIIKKVTHVISSSSSPSFHFDVDGELEDEGDDLHGIARGEDGDEEPNILEEDLPRRSTEENEEVMRILEMNWEKEKEEEE